MRELTVIALPGIIPEPWRVGQASAVRRGGKLGAMVTGDPALVNFQEAVRDELRALKVPLLAPNYHLRFWWWRELAVYEGKKRMVTKSRADQTNLQKALEDALQPCKESKYREHFDGVITNDRYCLSSGGMIRAQEKGVESLTVIEIVSGADSAEDRMPWGGEMTEAGEDMAAWARREGSSWWMTTDVP